MMLPMRVLVAVAGLLLISTSAMAYGHEQLGKGQQDRPMRDKTILEVLEEQTPGLMAMPGVVGTAQGECEGKPCIKIYVVEKTAELIQQIPSVLEGYPVEIQETGEIRALDPS